MAINCTTVAITYLCAECMKRKYLLIFFILSIFSLPEIKAQAKIGNRPELLDASAVLELESSDKGLRLPRVKLDDIHVWALAGALPASGMIVYNEEGLLPKGIYYWNTDLEQWVRVVNSAELSTLIAASTTVSNVSEGNKLSTTVNGKVSAKVDIVNSNVLDLTNGVLTTVINDVASTAGVNVVGVGNNGLTVTAGNVQLGGALVMPTTIAASSVNTFSITGLKEGNSLTDSLLVIAPTTGVVRKVSMVQAETQIAKVVQVASNGQRRFATPIIITDLKKVQVYRNGINVEFDQVDDKHIDLEVQATCYSDDEVKIIQLK